MKKRITTILALLLAFVMILGSVSLIGCTEEPDAENPSESGTEADGTNNTDGGNENGGNENGGNENGGNENGGNENGGNENGGNENGGNTDSIFTGDWEGATLNEDLEVKINWWTMQPIYFVGETVKASEYPVESFTDERANDVDDYETIASIVGADGKESLIGADGYTFTAAGKYTIYRYALKDGEYSKSEGYEISVVAPDGEAAAGVELYHAAVVGDTYVLKRSTVNGSMSNIILNPADFSYVAFTKDGGYGVGTFVSISFTGKNRPTIGMFLEADNTLLSGNSGFIVGDFAPANNPDFAYLNRMTVFDYASIALTGDIGNNPIRPANFTGTDVNDVPCGWNHLDDSKNYEMVVGTVADGAKLNLSIQLYEVAEGGAKTAVYSQTRDITNNGQYEYATQTGDIVLYGSNMAGITFSAKVLSANESDDIANPKYTVKTENGSFKVADGEAQTSASVRKGTEITVTANAPEAGKRFVKWVAGEAEVSTTATFTYTVAGDVTLTAVYEDIPTYAVKVTHGTFTVAGSTEAKTEATVLEGTEVTFTATVPAGYAFVKWTDADGKQVATTATYTVTVNGALNLTADSKDATVIKYFEVTVVGGKVSGGADDGKTQSTVQESLEITVTADAAATGKVFAGWKVGEKTVSTEATYTFAVEADTTVTATYSDLAKYTVTVVGGTIDGAASKEVFEGTEVTVVADAPESGKVFAGWKIGEETVSAATSYKFKPSASVTITAVFEDAVSDIALNKAVANADGTYTIEQSGLTAANRDNIYGDGANLDWGYVAFKGDYGADTWVSVTFTGKNRPSIGFGHEATNTFNATTGFIIGGSTSGGVSGTKGRLTIFNMNNIHTSGKLISSADRIVYTGTPLDPSVTAETSSDSIAPAFDYLDPEKTYEFAVGTWTEDGGKYMVGVVLFEYQEDGSRKCIYQQSRDANNNGKFSYEDETGDIVIYGAFDAQLTFSAEVITDADTIKAYKDARVDNVWQAED